MHCTKVEMCGVDSPLDKTWPVLGWVGWDWNFLYCSHQNFKSSDDVLEADWSVINKYRRVFDCMNINELSLSVTAAVGSSAVCRRRPTSHFWHKSLCCHKDFYVSKCLASIQMPHIQTVLTKHIEVAALGHNMWQFITVSCKATCYLYFSLLKLTISFSTLLEAL